MMTIADCCPAIQATFADLHARGWVRPGQTLSGWDDRNRKAVAPQRVRVVRLAEQAEATEVEAVR